MPPGYTNPNTFDLVLYVANPLGVFEDPKDARRLLIHLNIIPDRRIFDRPQTIYTQRSYTTFGTATSSQSYQVWHPTVQFFTIGSGPMIGSHVACLFAEHGFEHLALFSRSTSNSSRDASFVTSAVPSASVHTYEADVTDHASLSAALEKAVSDIRVPEVVLYNAARINYGMFGQYSIEDIVEDFKIPNLGLYTTASKLLPHLQALAKSHPDAHPALLAAQANMTKLLAEENKDIVHVALGTVGGKVSMEEKEGNPPNVASKSWELYEQKKGSWEFEIKCGW